MRRAAFVGFPSPADGRSAAGAPGKLVSLAKRDPAAYKRQARREFFDRRRKNRAFQHPDRGGGINWKPTSKSKAWTNPCDSAMTLERTRTITLPPPPSPCGPLGTGGSDYGNLKLSRYVLAQNRRCGYNFGDDKLDPRKSAEAASDQAVTSNAAVFTTGAGMQKQEKFFV